MACRVFLLALFPLSLAAQESDLELRVFRWINDAQNPTRNGLFEYLDYSSIPTFGAIPVGFLVVGALGDNPTAALAGSMSGVGQITALGLTLILKELISRPRPFEVLEHVQVKHRWSAGGRSFPSGHTSQAFAIATVISLNYKRSSIAIPLFIWATSVSLGRIYLGLHYPSDVLGGIVVGIAGGLAAWSLRTEIQSFSRKISAPEASMRFPLPEVNLVALRIPLN